jgi:hypothetical protein
MKKRKKLCKSLHVRKNTVSSPVCVHIIKNIDIDSEPKNTAGGSMKEFLSVQHIPNRGVGSGEPGEY